MGNQIAVALVVDRAKKAVLLLEQSGMLILPGLMEECNTVGKLTTSEDLASFNLFVRPVHRFMPDRDLYLIVGEMTGLHVVVDEELLTWFTPDHSLQRAHFYVCSMYRGLCDIPHRWITKETANDLDLPPRIHRMVWDALSVLEEPEVLPHVPTEGDLDYELRTFRSTDYLSLIKLIGEERHTWRRLNYTAPARQPMGHVTYRDSSCGTQMADEEIPNLTYDQ